MPKKTAEITVPADLSLSTLVRNLANDVFAEAGFSEAWRNRLKLVVDELFMNAVRYGSTPGKSLIRFRFIFDDSQIEFQIEDDGTGKNKITPQQLHEQISQNAQNHDVTRISGRGLSTITQLWTDGFRVESSAFGGLFVSFTKKVEVSPPPPLPFVLPPPADISVQDGVIQARIEAPVVIKLVGSMDQTNLPEVTEAVEKQLKTLVSHGRLVLDFASVDYINSTFIGHLAAWHNQAYQQGKTLQITNLTPLVKDVLNLVGLNKVIPII